MCSPVHQGHLLCPEVTAAEGHLCVATFPFKIHSLLKVFLEVGLEHKGSYASLSWFHPESSLTHTRLESEAKDRSALVFIWLLSSSPPLEVIICLSAPALCLEQSLALFLMHSKQSSSMEPCAGSVMGGWVCVNQLRNVCSHSSGNKKFKIMIIVYSFSGKGFLPGFGMAAFLLSFCFAFPWDIRVRTCICFCGQECKEVRALGIS